MDLVLAKADGLEVLQALSQMEPRPRVLVLSSFVRGSVAELAAASGADYYMMKPCRLAAVAERIRQLADGVAAGEAEEERNLESTVTAIIMRLAYQPISRDTNTCVSPFSLR